MHARGVARECRAQAVVEMAIVTPVLIVLALISCNLMIFAAAVARFDRVVPDIVLAHAVSPAGMTGAAGGEDATATVAAQIEQAMTSVMPSIPANCNENWVGNRVCNSKKASKKL